MRAQIGVVAVAAAIAAVTQAGEPAFKKHVLSRTFYSEGCAVADLNKDGKIDVIGGPIWYEAPDWKPHEIRPPGHFNYDGGYSESFVNGAMDVNLDGWEDVIIVGLPNEPALWYENPQGKPEHWKAHEITPWACNETPLLADVDKDGRLDLVCGFTPPSQDLGWMAWFAGPKDAKDLRWTLYAVSKPRAPGSRRYAHGLGVGDVNRDGRNDIIITEGWWESPADPTACDWTFHPAKLGPACADMIAYDVDNDGDADIISSAAHNYGIWWFEQGKAPDGQTTWTQHEIYSKFSQTHALRLADMNADGLPDLVTGKRFWAHNGRDPGEREPAVVYWFEFSRQDGKPTWTPHEVDNDSGIGTQFVVQDITGDGRPDIITSNKKGTFVFENVTP